MAKSTYQGEERRAKSSREGWHLDQKITIGLILALLANASSSIWWAAGVSSKLTEYERRITANEAFAARVDNSQLVVADRLARLEENSKTGNATLLRIEGTLKELRADTTHRNSR